MSNDCLHIVHTRSLTPCWRSRFHPPVLCRLEQDRFTLSIPACSATSLLFPSNHRSRRRQALNALFLPFSVCIGRIRLGNDPEVWGHRSNCHRTSWHNCDDIDISELNSGFRRGTILMGRNQSRTVCGVERALSIDSVVAFSDASFHRAFIFTWRVFLG